MKAHFLVVLLSLMTASPGLHADPGGCTESTGGFTNTLIPPPACMSPVGVCTHGLLGGDLAGASYDFTMNTLQPACDPADADCDPTRWVYTGDSLVTTDKGTIITADTGVIFMGGDVAPFVTTAEIVGGTLRYKNTSGTFVATGQVDFTTGQGAGGYVAEICHGSQEQ